MNFVFVSLGCKLKLHAREAWSVSSHMFISDFEAD